MNNLNNAQKNVNTQKGQIDNLQDENKELLNKIEK